MPALSTKFPILLPYNFSHLYYHLKPFIFFCLIYYPFLPTILTVCKSRILFCLQLYSWCTEQCLAHGRHWMNVLKWMKEWFKKALLKNEWLAVLNKQRNKGFKNLDMGYIYVESICEYLRENLKYSILAEVTWALSVSPFFFNFRFFPPFYYLF